MTAHKDLLALAFSLQLQQSVRIVCLYKIPDLIHSGKKSSKELAEATGLHEETLYRLIRATAVAKVVTYDEEAKTFELGEAGQLLRTDHPASLSNMFQFLTLPCRLTASLQYEESAKTGNNCISLATGDRDFFEYCKTHPDDRRMFDAGMTQVIGSKMHSHMAKQVPLDGVKVLVDVGGGHGDLLHEISKRAPEVKLIVFDLPEVISESPYKDSAALTLVGGSFFDLETFPKGADAAVMATVLHDWSDSHSLEILKNTRKVLPVGGKLFISENIISNTPSFTNLLDIEMLLLATGKERSVAGFQNLAKEAGFEFKTVYSPEGPGTSVLEFSAV